MGDVISLDKDLIGEFLDRLHSGEIQNAIICYELIDEDGANPGIIPIGHMEVNYAQGMLLNGLRQLQDEIFDGCETEIEE